MGGYLNANRNRPGPFEIRSYVWNDGFRLCLLGADDIGPEIRSGYKCRTPVSTDRCCVYEIPFGLSERWYEGEKFRREAVDGHERVLELVYVCCDGQQLGNHPVYLSQIRLGN